MTDPVTTYAKDVVGGKVACSKYVLLSCKRHLADLKQGSKRGLEWSSEEGQDAVEFFGVLKHSKGKWAGKPFVLSPWQAFIVGSLFGWKRKDGTRRFRVAYNEIPRKNGKSTLAAGIALRLAFFDREMGAEVYCAATKRDQAKIVFAEAKRMAEKTPSVKSRLTLLVANMNRPESASKLEPLGADADSTDGLNPHGVIIDELHAHKSAALVDVLQSAAGARTQPLRFEITTAGYDRTSVCWKHHDYSVRILEGTVEDDTWFAFISATDEGDDWREPKSWAKANLNLGVSVFPDYLAAECKRATEIPSEQNNFRRLHLNSWTEQSERWLDMSKWDACSAATEPRGTRPVFGGLDMASRMDLTAYVELYGPDATGTFDVVPIFWIPRSTLQTAGVRAEADRLMLQAWADQGFIELTDGDTVNYDLVERRILERAEENDLQELGHDRWNVTQLVTHLKDALGEHRVTAVPQTLAGMSSGSKELEKLVVAGKLRHGGHPVLRWTASNVSIKRGLDGHFKPDRQTSSEKIDGIVALVMALSIAARHSGGSIYDTDERPDGFLVLGAGTS